MAAVTVLLPEICVEDASCEVDVYEVEVAVVTAREAEVLGETVEDLAFAVAHKRMKQTTITIAREDVSTIREGAENA